jgi:hypothetical protein
MTTSLIAVKIFNEGFYTQTKRKTFDLQLPAWILKAWACAQTGIITLKRAHTHAHTHTIAHTRMHSHMHTHKHTHTHTHTNTHLPAAPPPAATAPPSNPQSHDPKTRGPPLHVQLPVYKCKCMCVFVCLHVCVVCMCAFASSWKTQNPKSQGSKTH